MAPTMCPGQNTAFWKPGDIFEITCPACGDKVEFFKDDARRRCPGCGYEFVNPRLNQGCAKWCKFAEKCLGINPGLHPDDDDGEKADGTGDAGQDGGGA
ncbi:MAG: hypothetical protein LBP95_12525 [Deltaproteobacteria bacterium]|nr:hypothetical protein [Deltaproteobacteria bacterium]